MHRETDHPVEAPGEVARNPQEFDPTWNWLVNQRQKYAMAADNNDLNQGKQFPPEYIAPPGFMPWNPWLYPPIDKQGVFPLGFHPLHPFYADYYNIPYNFYVPGQEAFRVPEVDARPDTRDPSLENLKMLNRAIKHIEEVPHINQKSNSPHQQNTPDETSTQLPEITKPIKKTGTHRSSRFCEVENCETTRHFGPPGGKTRFCFYHKEEGMINLSLRRCLECTKTASFGYTKTNRKEYCYEHRKPDTINLSLKRCGHPGCERPASSTHSGRKRCSLHKDDALNASNSQDLAGDSDAQSITGPLGKKVKREQSPG